MLSQPFHWARCCRASEKVSNMAQPDLDPMGRVASHSQCWNHLIPSAGTSFGMDRYELVCMFDVCFGQDGPPGPPLGLTMIAMSTLSYKTVLSAVGMQELMDSSSNGADRSCMTQNLPETFLAHKPSGEMTYARKTGPMKGPIILFAISCFSNFPSTASRLARTILLLPFTRLVLCSLSLTIWWTGQLSFRRKPFLNPSTR